MRRLGVMALAALFALPAQAESITVETAQGGVSIESTPETIVSLDIGAIDTLNALGVSLAGVPNPIYVDYLGSATDGATSIGTLFEPDFEALANIAPDAIIVGGRSAAQAEPLSEIAPVLDMTIGEGDHIAQVLMRLDTYGALTGTEAKAAELATAFTAKLDQAKAAVSGQGNALIVLTNGPKVSAYGIGSRFGWIHSALGLPEAVENVEAQTHGEAISFEFIAEANPDWLIVIDRGAAIGAEGESAAQTLDNALVAGTTAWQEGQVIYLNAANIYIAAGGIQSTSMTLDEIIAGFNGGS